MHPWGNHLHLLNLSFVTCKRELTVTSGGGGCFQEKAPYIAPGKQKALNECFLDLKLGQRGMPWKKILTSLPKANSFQMLSLSIYTGKSSGVGKDLGNQTHV